MYFKRLIQLVAVLLLGLAAQAAPSFSPVKKHKSQLPFHYHAIPHESMGGERPDNDSFFGELKAPQARRLRSKFRVPESFQKLVSKAQLANTSKSFAVFTEPLQISSDHFPPPFYYVFLFRLTLF
jgi:hypothetical protein